MQLQIQQLQAAVKEMKQEAERYHTETMELKAELEATRNRLSSVAVGSPTAPPPLAETLPAKGPEAADETPEKLLVEERIEKVEEDQELLNSRMTEQYQTKVESASKYRVRLSGLALFNLFSNSGNVDHVEVPTVAAPPLPGANTDGSFAATLRQSQFGLEVHGPEIAGAKTEGHFVADFFGEFPESVNGSASGTLRLRTGTIRLDWERTSLVGGIDNLFFSPTYATSYAQVAIPAFSYSGNLYSFTPQLRVEHRMAVSESSTLTLSGGILDPLTGETPLNEFLRAPVAGENSRQPGYATRLEWSRKVAGQPLTLGLGGYYNRENYGFNRNLDGWVASTDWSIPLGQYFGLSGKFFSGRAIGGLGAGVGRSVIFTVPPDNPNPSNPFDNPKTLVHGLRTTGGWAQLKFQPLAKFEVNAAAGQDGVNAEDLRALPGAISTPGYFDAGITRNRSEFVNFIYRPRSNLLFSTEFRTLRTFALPATSQRANQLNLVMGVLF
jgi:hypothetical protein